MSNELKGVIPEHVRAVNAFGADAIVATFAKDAYVNDNRREIAGIDAIRRWVEKEMVGDKVTLDVREVVEHYGDTIVWAAYDGEYDKTDLPPGVDHDELLQCQRRKNRKPRCHFQSIVPALSEVLRVPINAITLEIQ